jgi:multicomponent Na+:H+ antiporter subunit D
MFAANDILIYVGLAMIFYGIIYAMLENNIRRVLCYSIVNQVGFMITAVGIGSENALKGAALHAFCHIFYKELLLMSAASVIIMSGKEKCSELGGLYKTMKITCICGVIGALSISAFPFTSGFISKSVIMEAAHIEYLDKIYYMLLVASAGVFLHAGIKFPWFVFFAEDKNIIAKDPPLLARSTMVGLSTICILIGILPGEVYRILPGGLSYQPYNLEHILTQISLLAGSALAFFIMLPALKRTDTITLDSDFIIRIWGRGFYHKMEHQLYIIKSIMIEKMNLNYQMETIKGLSYINNINAYNVILLLIAAYLYVI